MVNKTTKMKLKDFITLIKSSALIILLLISTLSSCALIIELDKLDEQKLKTINSPKGNYCPLNQKSNLTIASSDKELAALFSTINKKLKKYNLSFIDQFVLLALIQVNLRPDLASPSSNLYLLINNNKHLSFTYNKQNSMPYLFGLNYLLKQHQSRYRLRNFAKWLDKYLKGPKIVGKEFAEYLKNNQNNLKNYPSFKKYFFKAEHPLSIGESLPHLNYQKMIRNYKKQNKVANIRNFLFPYKTDNNDLDIKCNYDFKLYDKSHYLIAKKEKTNLPFGISDNKGNSMLAITTQGSDTSPAPHSNSFLINSPSKTDSLAMCLISNKKIKSNLVIVSTGSRDPGQLIYHLIQYEIFNSKSINEASEYINFPRHLFLLNPVRMVYESERGSTTQLSRFLSMNFPIYHAESIGNIWVYGKFNESKQSGIITDPRSRATLSCF